MPSGQSKRTLRARHWLGLAWVLATTPVAAGPAIDALRGPFGPPPGVQATAPIPGGFGVGRSVAPEPTLEPSLDLEACVRIALDRNPLVRAAREGVAAATAGVGVAKASHYPEVGVTAGYRRFDTHLFLPAEVPLLETTLGATDDWSSAVAVGYTLYDHGQRRAERSVALAARAASEDETRRVRQDIVHAVHQTYYRVLSARAGIASAETALSRRRDHLELAVVRWEAGAAPRADVLRAQVEAADAELALVGARAALRVADGNLRTAMGLPVDMPLSVEDLEEVPAAPGDLDLAAALQRALEQRPELDAARRRVAAARSHAAVIKGIYGPRVGAEASVGWRDSDFLPEDENWAAGVSLRLPLFSGFAKTHRLSRADAQRLALEAEAEALADRIELEVWNAASGLAASYEAVLRSDVLHAVAEESVGFARARYEAGASAIADLLDAESALSQADAAQVRAILEYRLARVSLLRAQGDL